MEYIPNRLVRRGFRIRGRTPHRFRVFVVISELNMQFEQTHQPVMVTEVLKGLNLQKDGIYIDATFGRGGHSQAILDNLGSKGRLLALDRDPSAQPFALAISS